MQHYMAMKVHAVHMRVPQCRAVLCYKIACPSYTLDTINMCRELLFSTLKSTRMLVPPTEGLQLGTSPHREVKQVRC